MFKGKIVVLMGGPSTEREVSLRTGGAIYQALSAMGCQVTTLELDRNVAAKLQAESPDVVFIAVHGKYGEDGVVQGVLDLLDIPYTGSGVLASALAMDKAMSKKIFLASGVPTPAATFFGAAERAAGSMALSKDVLADFALPVVVKAATQGSSIGVTIVDRPDTLAAAIDEAFGYSETVVVEQFIAGREVTVTVLGNERPEALPIIEIAPKTGRYDYQSKYTKGATEYIVPARLAPEVYAALQKSAVKAHRALGCKGVSRVDFIVGPDGKFYALEVNTIPGMTETSLVPKAAAAAGMEFGDFLLRLIDLAVK
ncbi:MAG TPA: D-alanine--D-alanine ligase [Negativicutes bacterium]|nr:D-alanine--D-alanine ligase [Negativicutes bacterium]